MSLLVVRIIVLCLLFIGTLVFGTLPICIRRRLNSCECSGKTHQPGCQTKKYRLATSFLIFFAGGVLLSTCLIHLLHEARQGFEETFAKCNETAEATNTTAEWKIDIKSQTTHKYVSFEQTTLGPLKEIKITKPYTPDLRTFATKRYETTTVVSVTKNVGQSLQENFGESRYYVTRGRFRNFNEGEQMDTSKHFDFLNTKWPSGVPTAEIKSETSIAALTETEKRLRRDSGMDSNTQTGVTEYLYTTSPPTFQGKFTVKNLATADKISTFESIVCNGYIMGSLFPLPEFVTVCGFFLIYFVEESIHTVINLWRSSKRKLKRKTRKCSHKKESVNCILQKPTDIQSLNMNLSLSEFEDGAVQIEDGRVLFTNAHATHLVFDVPESATIRDDSKDHPDNESDQTEEALADLLTVIALSFHSIFEGFAAGFQHTVISTWMLFFSLALHKFVSAFVVGIETLHSGSSNYTVTVYMTVFSFMTPLGMVAAILTHENLEESSFLLAGVLNALSVGTLLYVTFFEMLRQRKDYAQISGLSQFCASLFGFGSMSLIEYFYTKVEQK